MRIKHFIVGLTLIPPLLLSLGLWAQGTKEAPNQGCVFNFKAYVSPLDNKTKAYKTLDVEKKDDTRKILTQIAILKTGEKLEFTGGGCAHHSFTYTYTNLRFKSGKDFDRAIGLLQNSPDNEGNSKLLIGALQDAMRKDVKKKPEGTYELPCGDATCILDVAQKDRLQISYDFPL
jgi:hypothetical protein